MNKRVEIYIGFKCNNNCLFCVERQNRLRYKNNNYYSSIKGIEDKISALKEQGYNHINFLGGEPFIEKSFLNFLEIAKKNGFSTAVTTNGSILANDEISKKHLPLIDDLIISIHGHRQNLIAKLSNNKNLFTNLIKAFENVKRYFKGRLLKTNTVINSLNYKYLPEIVEFIQQKGIKEISLTNMSIKGFNNGLIVKLSEIKKVIISLATYAKVNGILLRFSDIPFCILGENYYLANELFADQRQKYNIENKKEDFMRPKVKPSKCNSCFLVSLCPGVDLEYYKLFGANELKPVYEKY